MHAEGDPRTVVHLSTWTSLDAARAFFTSDRLVEIRRRASGSRSSGTSTASRRGRSERDHPRNICSPSEARTIVRHMTASPSTLTASRRPARSLAAVPEAAETAPHRPRSATVALYAAGMVIGFLLAAVASAPGGGAMVAWQLVLAAVAGVVCLAAARRARVQRRTARGARRTVAPIAQAPETLRRAA